MTEPNSPPPPQVEPLEEPIVPLGYNRERKVYVFFAVQDDLGAWFGFESDGFLRYHRGEDFDVCNDWGFLEIRRLLADKTKLAEFLAMESACWPDGARPPADSPYHAVFTDANGVINPVADLDGAYRRLNRDHLDPRCHQVVFESVPGVPHADGDVATGQPADDRPA